MFEYAAIHKGLFDFNNAQIVALALLVGVKREIIFAAGNLVLNPVFI